MDESYDTWIANLIAGRVSPAEQAMRAKFRAMQSPCGRHAGAERPVAAVYTGRHNGDALTTYAAPANASGINGWSRPGCASGTLAELGL